jgi:hypothetical protein
MAIYEYAGKTYDLADGLSNEAALSKIKTSLGETPAPEAPSMLSRVGNEAGRQAGLTARAGITGLTAVPAMFADFLTGVGGLATGRAIKPSSQALQEFMTQVGLPEPQGTMERAVQSGVGAMVGTGAQAAVAQGIPALSTLAANVPQQLAASGAGGALGQAAAEKVTGAVEDPMIGTAAGIAAGLVAGTLGGSVAGKSVSGAIRAPTPTVTIEDIRNRASIGYKTVESKGVTLKPRSILNMLDNAESALIKDNFNPLLETHKPVATVLDQMRSMTGTERVSFTKLEQMRSAAGALKTSNDAATRNYAGGLVSEIDNYIASIKGTDLIAGKAGLDDAVTSVQSARKDWRNMSKATILEDALNVAEARALDPKASEGDLIRKQLIGLAANKKKLSQFSPQEQNAIKSVAKGGMADPLLTLAARFNPARSQMIVGGMFGGGVASPQSLQYTLPAGALGFAADKFQGFTRGRDMRGLISNVAGGITPSERAPSAAFRGLLAGGQPPEQEQ